LLLFQYSLNIVIENTRGTLTSSKTIKDDKKISENHFVEFTFGILPICPNPKA